MKGIYSRFWNQNVSECECKDILTYQEAKLYSEQQDNSGVQSCYIRALKAEIQIAELSPFGKCALTCQEEMLFRTAVGQLWNSRVTVGQLRRLYVQQHSSVLERQVLTCQKVRLSEAGEQWGMVSLKNIAIPVFSRTAATAEFSTVPLREHPSRAVQFLYRPRSF